MPRCCWPRTSSITVAVAIFAALAMHLFEDTSAAVAVTAVVMSIVVVVFAKLAPKGIAGRNPDRLAHGRGRPHARPS